MNGAAGVISSGAAHLQILHIHLPRYRGIAMNKYRKPLVVIAVVKYIGLVAGETDHNGINGFEVRGSPSFRCIFLSIGGSHITAGAEVVFRRRRPWWYRRTVSVARFEDPVKVYP